MEYKTKKCPHCGKVYTRFEPGITSNRRESPLKICSFCGNQFFDDDYFEPALKPYKPSTYAGSLISGIIIFALIMFPMPALLTWYFKWSPIVLVGIFAIYAFLMIRGAINNKETTDKQNADDYKAWLESDNRLRNKEYAVLLKQHGFKVPDRYLH